MLKTRKIILKSLALALVFAMSQLSLGTVMASVSQQIIAKIITAGGSARVNDTDATSGSSIVSGATIETPANVSATIQIGSLGVVELSPGSIAVIQFTDNTVNVTLKQGCVVLQTNKGTSGAITDSKGTALKTNSEAEEGVFGEPDYRRVAAAQAKSDGSTRRRFPVCGIIPVGSSVVTAPAAGAVAGAAGAGAAAGGLSAAAIAAIVAGVAGGAIIAGIVGTRGGNPSPGAP